MTREEFEKSRTSYWPKVKEEMRGEPGVVVALALLADIHTMLEYAFVEPECEDREEDINGP